MSDVKFTMSADASDLFRAEDKVIEKERAAARAFEESGRAATRASEEAERAIKNQVKAYELADQQIKGMQFVGSGGTSRGQRVAPLSLAPTSSPQQVATAGIAPFRGPAYRVAGDRWWLDPSQGGHAPGQLGPDPFATRSAAEDVARQIREEAAQRKARKVATERLAERDRLSSRVAADGVAGLVRDEAAQRRQRIAEAERAMVMSTAEMNIDKAKAAKLKRDELISNGINMAGAAVVGGVAIADKLTVKYIDDVKHATAANREFEDSLGPLLSLGDNMGDSNKIREQALAFSSAWGVAAPDVVAYMADVQRSMQGASETIRRDLLNSVNDLTELAGGSFADNLRTTTKLIQAFGDAGENATAIPAKLAQAYRGGMPVEDMALIASITPGAKGVGFNFDEVIALAQTGTQLGGKNSRMAKAGAELLGRLPALEAAGLDVSGSKDLGEKVKRMVAFLNQSPELGPKTFSHGGETFLKALGGNGDLLAKNLASVRNTTPADLDRLVIQRLNDPNAAMTALQKSAERTIANVDIKRGMDPKMMKEELDAMAWEIGHKMTTPKWKLAAEGETGLRMAKLAAMKDPDNNDEVLTGYGQLVSDLQATKDGGDRFLADRARLTRGKMFGLKIGTRTEKELYWNNEGVSSWMNVQVPVYSGPAEAIQFGKLRENIDLNAESYLNYRGMVYKGNQAGADAYLYNNRNAGFADLEGSTFAASAAALAMTPGGFGGIIPSVAQAGAEFARSDEASGRNAELEPTRQAQSGFIAALNDAFAEGGTVIGEAIVRALGNDGDRGGTSPTTRPGTPTTRRAQAN